MRGFGCAPFLYADEGDMIKNIHKKIIDVTGIELTPGNPTACLGNGERGFECCCDECDYFLCCFPKFDIQIKEEDISSNKDNTLK